MRGHENVLKRLLVQASGFNLGLWMRTLFAIGTPRGLQGRPAALGPVLSTLWTLVYDTMGTTWPRSLDSGRSSQSADGPVAVESFA